MLFLNLTTKHNKYLNLIESIIIFGFYLFLWTFVTKIFKKGILKF